MIRHSRWPIAPPTLLSEIEGYTALGMKTEALALCRRALQLERLDDKLFCGVVDSVDRFVLQKRRWILAIESAYRRLPQRAQRRARVTLLLLEAELKRDAEVLRLAPRQYRGELACLELVFLAEAAVTTREWQVFRSISRRLKQAAKDVLAEELRAWIKVIIARASRAGKRVVPRP